jgi:membrane protease YdiL (CAAX protease family)
VLARAAALLRDHPLLTPLLIVCAAINLLALVFEFGPSNVPFNLVLLAVYVSVIHFATRDRPTAVTAVHRPEARSRDIGFGVAVAVLQFAGVAIFWFVIFPHGLVQTWAADLRAAGVPSLVASKAASAAIAVPLLLIPTLVAVAAFRFRPGDVGLIATPRDLLLGVVLAVIGIALGLGAVSAGGHPGLMWESAALPTVTAALAFQSLINGIPEELAYRGVILSRLMPWLGRPGNSLAISSMVFGLSHVPSYLAAGNSLGLSLAIGLFGLLPGLLLGYVFYRTRSIWPGAIWHTSIATVALLFWPHT